MNQKAIDAAIDSAMDTIYKAIEEAIKASGQKKCYMLFSAFEQEDNGVPINNLNEVAIKGKVVVVRKRSRFVGDKHSQNYRSGFMRNPSWLQLCICANKAVRTTRDPYHCIFEGVREVTKLPMDEMADQIIHDYKTYTLLLTDE